MLHKDSGPPHSESSVVAVGFTFLAKRTSGEEVVPTIIPSPSPLAMMDVNIQMHLGPQPFAG